MPQTSVKRDLLNVDKETYYMLIKKHLGGDARVQDEDVENVDKEAPVDQASVKRNLLHVDKETYCMMIKKHLISSTGSWIRFTIWSSQVRC